MAWVHGVRLRDGAAQWYRDRWIRTPAVVRRLGELVLDIVRRPSVVVTDLHGAQRGFGLLPNRLTRRELDENDLRTAWLRRWRRVHGANRQQARPGTPERWIIDLAAGKVREIRLYDHPQEFARIDDRLLGHQYRYGYAMQALAGGDAGDSVLKPTYIVASPPFDATVPAAAGERDPEQLREQQHLLFALRQQLAGVERVKGQQAEDLRTRGDGHRYVGLIIIVSIGRES
jgi:hypothetical protein